jgi:uncharacterized protein
VKYSRFNIISKLADSDDFFIVNSLSGNADVLSNYEMEMYRNSEALKNTQWIEKGYVVHPEDEERLYRKKYLDFIDSRESDEIQIFYVPNYTCNFNCSYCYQNDYQNETAPFSEEVINAFFSYVSSKFIGRNKYITLFGGEPLLMSSRQQDSISYFVDKCLEQGIELAVVTNGYHLKDYIPVLSKASIREIQVTLDGTASLHNKRRPLKNGNETFAGIVDGIDAALKAGMPVNLRMVIDKENIDELPRLARFAKEKGWTEHSLFKTQLGRNYELHFCQSAQSKLYSRIEMYQDVYRLIKNHPEILDFHKPAFSISKFLFDNGELPDPLFDSCPGCKTEWAFDYTGSIYSCTATVGKSDEKLGTFYPGINLYEDMVEEWEERDVLSIEKCKDCEVQLICGGGCASIAKNQSGSLHSPDCRPVKALLELGIGLYRELDIIKVDIT